MRNNVTRMVNSMVVIVGHMDVEDVEDAGT